MQPQPPRGPSDNPPGWTGNPQDETGDPQQSGYSQGQDGYPQDGYPQAGQPTPDQSYPQYGQPYGYAQVPGQTGYPQDEQATRMPQTAWGQQLGQTGYPQQEQSADERSYLRREQSADETAYLQREQSIDRTVGLYPGLDPTDQPQQAPEQAAHAEQIPDQQAFDQQGRATPGQTSYPQGQYVPGRPGYDPNAYPRGPMIIPPRRPTSRGGRVGATAARVGRRLRSVLGTVIGFVVVLGLVYLASWGCHQINKPDAEKVQVGQCVKVAGTTNNPKVDITDCSSMDANYMVAEREDRSTATCPEGNYASVWETGSGGYNLCLQLNVQQDDCIDKQFDNTTKVSCDNPEANYKVTDVLNNTTSDSACSNAASKYLTYTKPDEMVVCLSPVH